MIDAILTAGPTGPVFNLKYPRYLHGYFVWLTGTHMIGVAVVEPEESYDILAELRDEAKLAWPSFEMLSKDKPCAEGKTATEFEYARTLWGMAALDVAAFAEAMLRMPSFPKEIVLRMISPFGHIEVQSNAMFGWDPLLAKREDNTLPEEVRELLTAMWQAKKLRMM